MVTPIFIPIGPVVPTGQPKMHSGRARRLHADVVTKPGEIYHRSVGGIVKETWKLGPVSFYPDRPSGSGWTSQTAPRSPEAATCGRGFKTGGNLSPIGRGNRKGDLDAWSCQFLSRSAQWFRLDSPNSTPCLSTKARKTYIWT